MLNTSIKTVLVLLIYTVGTLFAHETIRITTLSPNNGVSGYGSGVLLDSGHVITCNHVLIKSTFSEFIVSRYGNEGKTRSEIYRKHLHDPLNDIAILYQDSWKSLDESDMRKEPPLPGESVQLLVFSPGEGIVVKSMKIKRLSKNGFFLSGVAVPGNSGGAVLDKKGKILGIVQYVIESNFETHVTKIEYAKTLKPIKVYKK